MKRLVKKAMDNMQIIYAQEKFPNKTTKSIFLAGPTPRDNNTKSWRNEAIDIFEQLHYDGILYIPEAKDGKMYNNYDNQIKWEQEAMERSDLILFWIPRDMKDMPALTTNQL